MQKVIRLVGGCLLLGCVVGVSAKNFQRRQFRFADDSAVDYRGTGKTIKPRFRRSTDDFKAYGNGLSSKMRSVKRKKGWVPGTSFDDCNYERRSNENYRRSKKRRKQDKSIKVGSEKSGGIAEDKWAGGTISKYDNVNADLHRLVGVINDVRIELEKKFGSLDNLFINQKVRTKTYREMDRAIFDSLFRKDWELLNEKYFRKSQKDSKNKVDKQHKLSEKKLSDAHKAFVKKSRDVRKALCKSSDNLNKLQKLFNDLSQLVVDARGQFSRSSSVSSAFISEQKKLAKTIDEQLEKVGPQLRDSNSIARALRGV